VFFPGYKPFGFDPELQFEESLLYCLPAELRGPLLIAAFYKIKNVRNGYFCYYYFCSTYNNKKK